MHAGIADWLFKGDLEMNGGQSVMSFESVPVSVQASLAFVLVVLSWTLLLHEIKRRKPVYICLYADRKKAMCPSCPTS